MHTLPWHLTAAWLRYLRELWAGWPWLLVALLAAATLTQRPAWLTAAQQRAPRVFAVGPLAATVAVGLYLAWGLLWASDDAYIAFRYSRNLARGEGLVFNVGERVEGYTDFLWTVLAALPERLGIHPAQAAIVFNLGVLALLLVVVARLAPRVCPAPPGAARLAFSPAAALCAVNYTLTSFATSALETLFAALLVVLALERAQARRWFAAGLLGVAATLTHPDHLLFYGCLGLALLSTRPSRRDLLAYALPFILVFVPYFAWRWSFYGDLMPNTYYAKSGGAAYPSQGLVYFALTLFGGGLLAVLPLAALGAWSQRSNVIGRFALVSVPLYVGYVIKVGGDFMLGRFFAPVLVLCFLFAEIGLRHLLNQQRVRAATALACLAAVAVVPTRLIRPGELFHGVADERTFTPVTDFATMTIDAAGYRVGRALHAAFAHRPDAPKVAVFSLGMAAYEGDLPVFDLRGLTSREVAHLPLQRRGRPGHEKLASPAHVVDAQVLLSEMSVYPPPYDARGVTRLGDGTFHLVRYQPALVERLGLQRAVDSDVRHVLRRLARATPPRIACDLWYLSERALTANPSPRLRERALNAATHADPSLAPVRELLLADPAAQGYQRLRSFEFNKPPTTWQHRGQAREFTRAAQLRSQQAITGHRGALLNTFTARAGDVAQGELRSPRFVLQGDALTLRVGGGHDLERLSVELVVHGRPVQRATGCETEWLGRRAWDLRPWRGQEAQLVVRDAHDGAWGHLIVDEIEEWRAPTPATTPPRRP